jgi:hypothetical protein
VVLTVSKAGQLGEEYHQKGILYEKNLLNGPRHLFLPHLFLPDYVGIGRSFSTLAFPSAGSVLSGCDYRLGVIV